MAKNNIAPAKAGATPEELEAKKLAAEAQAKAEAEAQAKAEAEAQAKAEAEAKAKAEAEAQAKVEEKPTPVNGEFEVDGRKYKLSDRCPGKLQFGGKVYTREELLTNEEIQQSLVIGGSPFVKKV